MQVLPKTFRYYTWITNLYGQIVTPDDLPHITWNCFISYLNFFYFFIDEHNTWSSRLNYLVTLFVTLLVTSYPKISYIPRSQLLHLICVNTISVCPQDQLSHIVIVHT